MICAHANQAESLCFCVPLLCRKLEESWRHSARKEIWLRQHWAERRKAVQDANLRVSLQQRSELYKGKVEALRAQRFKEEALNQRLSRKEEWANRDRRILREMFDEAVRLEKEKIIQDKKVLCPLPKTSQQRLPLLAFVALLPLLLPASASASASVKYYLRARLCCHEYPPNCQRSPRIRRRPRLQRQGAAAATRLPSDRFRKTGPCCERSSGARGSSATSQSTAR
jgi:hypothetical protein